MILPGDYTRCAGEGCDGKEMCARYVSGVMDPKSEYASWTSPSALGVTNTDECPLFIPPVETPAGKIPCVVCGGDGHFLASGTGPNSNWIAVCELCGGDGYLA